MTQQVPLVSELRPAVDQTIRKEGWDSPWESSVRIARSGHRSELCRFRAFSFRCPVALSSHGAVGPFAVILLRALPLASWAGIITGWAFWEAVRWRFTCWQFIRHLGIHFCGREGRRIGQKEKRGSLGRSLSWRFEKLWSWNDPWELSGVEVKEPGRYTLCRLPRGGVPLSKASFFT